jgi:hypothetical protein
VLVGSIQQCKLGKDMYKKDSFFAKIRILDVHQERLGDISLDSCEREGYKLFGSLQSRLDED